MLYFDGFAGLVVLAVWIFCFIDVLLTPETAVRSLPKLAWIFIVLLFPLIGSIAWLVAGRPWDRTTIGTVAGSRPRGAFVPTNPDDDEEFLASLRQRAEEQRRRAREAHRDTDPQDPGATA